MIHRILRTNHTSFTVSALERTLAYFTGVLGFETTSIAARDPALIQAITAVPGAELRIAYVRGPDHSVELIEYTGPADRDRFMPRPCDVGFAHLAFDVEGMASLIAALAPFDVHPLGAPVTITNGPNAGRQVVYLRDRDGLTIELIGT